MKYREKMISELTDLENYARTCFVKHLHLQNGQGATVNEFIDSFMADLTDGEFCFDNGTQITLDDCLDFLLNQCRKAETTKDTYLWYLVGDWIHDNVGQCEECGELYNCNKIECYDGYCESCQAERNANDPDTIADFMNDLRNE